MDIGLTNRKVEVERIKDNIVSIKIDGVGEYLLPREKLFILPMNNEGRYLIAFKHKNDLFEIVTNKIRLINLEVL